MDDFKIWVIIIGVVLIVVLFIFLSQPKCPMCGKRKSSLSSKKKVGEERISIKKTETIKHYSKENTHSVLGRPTLGSATPTEAVSVREYTVPGIRTYYDVTYTCQVCGESYSRREHEDTEV